MLPTTEKVFEASVAALEARGVPVDRVSASLAALHPEVFVLNMIWTRGEGFAVREREHAIVSTAAYLESPVARIHAGESSVRCDLRGPVETIPFPVCRDLKAAGFTDYVIHPLPQGRRLSYAAFATRAGEGFAADALVAIEREVVTMGRALEVEHARYVLDSLLAVYLGKNAAERVLAGTVKRGTGQSIRAAIWTCDLRGFTTLADSRPPAEVVHLLDRYFDAVGEPIERGGGEILKFIGDAVLAVFPLEGDDPAPCRRALAAADEAVTRLARESAASVETGGPTLELGIALHVGEVFYGNVGAARRLDFTVIGAAVNEVARVEPFCKTLGVPLLVTDAFRDCVPEHELVELGAHALRGASRPRRLYTLPRFVGGRGPASSSTDTTQP